MIRPLDAWVLARLLAGETVNGELETVSDAFRPIAYHLVALSLVDRGPAWDAFQAGRNDREAITIAVANSDPLGPAPEANADPDGDGEGDARAEGWEPNYLGTLPPAEPFPLDVLPETARKLAKVAAKSIACPADYPAVTILGAASGIIGRSASLRIKSGYFASALLWVALVGGPSSGVKAAYSKHRREEVQPVPAELVETLRAWLDGKGREEPVFGNLTKHTNLLIQPDLEVAGIPYVDGNGLFAEFHAIRHSYVTALAICDAPVKIVQSLARHSTPSLTLAVYSHVGLNDQPRAMCALPSLPGPGKGSDRRESEPIRDDFAHHLPTGGGGTGRLLADSLI
jgi:hypothetical protein